MLGRMARNDLKRNNDLLTFNLTVLADGLYNKAKLISPKAVHQHDVEAIRTKLLTIFNCTHCSSCSPILDKYNLADFIKNSINIQVSTIIKSVNKASVYLNSLR